MCIEHEQIQSPFSSTEIIIAHRKLRNLCKHSSSTFPNISVQGKSQTKKWKLLLLYTIAGSFKSCVWTLQQRKRRPISDVADSFKQWLETCRKSTCDSLLWNTCYLRWDFYAQRVVLSSDINFFETRNKIVYRICISLFKVLSRI